MALEEFKRVTIDDLQLRELSQLTRIFKIAEPNCSIIYIAPAAFTSEVLKYYSRVFLMANQTEKWRDRLTIISIESTLQRMFPHLTTVSALLYDSRSLLKVKQAIKDKQQSLHGNTCSYIVPGYPSTEYTSLSAELRIPLLSGPPALCKYYSSKSGHYQFLRPLVAELGAECPFLLPESAVDIYTEEDLISTLAILIFQNQSSRKWLLKIDDEINGRGIAVLNLDAPALLKGLRWKQEIPNGVSSA
jgi:hypothetical protein